MKRYLIPMIAFGIVATFFFLFGTVFAHHYQLFGEDYTRQRTKDENGRNNYMQVKWALTPRPATPGPQGAISYYIDNNISNDETTAVANPALTRTAATLNELVDAAVADWTSKIPQLRWVKASSNSTADVVFSLRNCGDFQAGNFEVDDWHLDATGRRDT